MVVWWSSLTENRGAHGARSEIYIDSEISLCTAVDAVLECPASGTEGCGWGKRCAVWCCVVAVVSKMHLAASEFIFELLLDGQERFEWYLVDDTIGYDL